jgi:hypothetical protein
MRPVVSVATILLIAHSAAARSPEDHKDMSGQYFCYYTGIAGIKREEGKPDYFGRITLPENKQKFFIKVERIKRSPNEVEFCKNTVDRYLDDLREGQEYQDWDYNHHKEAVLQQREWVGWKCFTKDTLSFKYPGEERSQEYRSYDLQFEFYGLSPSEWFQLFANGGFRRSEQFDSGTVAVEAGRCEKITSPN